MFGMGWIEVASIEDFTQIDVGYVQRIWEKISISVKGLIGVIEEGL